MDIGWVVTVASPTDSSAQVNIIGNDDMAAPGISVEVADVDAVHAKAVEQGFEIAYPLRDEEWGVRRFMLREPSGTVVNVLSHRSGFSACWPTYALWPGLVCRGVPGDAPQRRERVRAAEVAARCASDLGTGFPFEHGLHSTLIAMRLAERLGVDARPRRRRTTRACCPTPAAPRTRDHRRDVRRRADHAPHTRSCSARGARW